MSESSDDEPLYDVRGYRRAGIAAPGFRARTGPVNAGRKMPAESLTVDEIQRLMAVPGATLALDKRNRAMTWLLYRVGVKRHELLALRSAHYAFGSNTLTIPGGQRSQERVVTIDAVTRGHLDEWIEQRRLMRVRPSVPLFCSVGHPPGRPLNSSTIGAMLRNRGVSAGIEKRVSAEGLRKSGLEHSPSRGLSLEAQIESYIDEVAFGARYPEAYRKWRDAVDLYTINAERHATRIGHDCREALTDFAKQLARHQGVDDGTLRPERTIDTLRAVIASKEGLSATVAAQLRALLAYFGTVSDLGQRQEHGATREGEPLTPDDARRVVFYTMLVMYEVDRTLSSLPPGERRASD